MAVKRNSSLDRIKNPTHVEEEKIEINQVLCPRCGRQGRSGRGYFYPSKNPNFAHTKSVPFCKSCVQQIYQTALVQYGDEHIAFRILCSYTNSYYDDSIVDNLKTNGIHKVGEYMKLMNLDKYANLTFEDTIIENADLFSKSTDEATDSSDTEDGKGVPQKAINMFGDGYSEDEYRFLLDQYKDWVRRYDCNQKSLEEMIKSICLMQLNIRNAANSGADISKLVKSLNDTISAANLQPITDTEDKDTYSYGELIEKFEEDRPIPKDPQFEDVDGIAKYIGTWFFGGLTRVFGKRNEFSDMYDEEIAKYTVTKPHYEEDEDLSTDDIFGDGGENG